MDSDETEKDAFMIQDTPGEKKKATRKHTTLFGDGGILGYEGLFLVITIIVILVVLLTVKNFTLAILIVGLITNFVIISTHLTLMGDRHAEMARIKKDSFTTATTALPGGASPSFTNIPADEPGTDDIAYPGSIEEFGEYETYPELGHTDWRTTARDDVPYGNPFSTHRIASPQAAGPDDDDYAVVALDGDEAITVQARSRNDPTRAWAGSLRQKSLIGRYVSEELDERENCRWWGQHEG